MKFVCDRCHTRYSIADEKVRQRILRIRCKTCSNVITVQAGEVVAGPQDSSKRPESGVRASSASAVRPSSKPSRPPSGLHEWFVAVDGVEQGPLSCADAAKYIVSRKPEQSVHVWKEGMDGWKAPKDVAIIAQEISELRRPPVGPSPHAPAAPARAGSASTPRPTSSLADSAARLRAPGSRPKPPPAGGSGSSPKLPQPGSGLKLSPSIPGSGPKVAPPPIPGSGPKVAPPPTSASGPKAPPPVPGSGPKSAPAGGSGSELAQHRVSGSEPRLGMPGSGPKLPPPTSGSGSKSPQSVLPDSLAETPPPKLGAGAPHPVPKLSLVPSPKKGPGLPGLTPMSAGTPTPTLESEFDKAPTTKPEKRPSGDRGVATLGTHVPDIPQATLPRQRTTEDNFDQGQKTPPPKVPLPPIVAQAGDGHDGKNSPPSALSFAHPPALPPSLDFLATGPAAAPAVTLLGAPTPSAGSLFSNLAALPAVSLPGPHAEAGLSKLTGLAALVHRHRHLKYVVAAGVVVVLVILVILLSWRSEGGKAAGSVGQRASNVPAAPALGEAETPPQDEHTVESVGRIRGRAAARGGSRRSAIVHSAGPSGKAVAVGEDPFERPSAPANSAERPAPVVTPSQPRRSHPGPSGGEGKAISQSQISEVVRSKENQAGIKSCYERALKRDGRLRTGRLDITV